MYLIYLITLIMIILVAIVILGAFLLSSPQPLNISIQFHSDLKIAREVLISDSYLHRLLMIEIIRDRNTREIIPNNIPNRYCAPDHSNNNHLLTNQSSSASHDDHFNNNTRYASNYGNTVATAPTCQNNNICTEPSAVSSSPRAPRAPGHLIRPALLADNSSEIVTFTKMSNGIESLGKSLVRSFGGAVAQRITTLMKTRNEIIRDYYRAMRNVICKQGTCVHVIELNPSKSDESSGQDPFNSEIFSSENTPISACNEVSSSGLKEREILNTITESRRGSTIISPIFPQSLGNIGSESISPLNSVDSLSSLDITTITLRKLESITREITDTIASSLYIRDVNQTGDNSSRRSIIHYQRLFNLVIMYDKELINQAKSYASKQYNISMNCAQSSTEITHHIADELNMLMRESQQKVQTL